MRNIQQLLLLSILSATFAAPAQAQEKQFDGIYIAADIGHRSAHSNLAGDEDIRIGSALYYGGAVGWRTQSATNWVWGAEATFGDIDGFQNQAFAGGLNTARVRNVWSANAYIGRVFGPKGRNLISAGGGYASMRAGFNLMANELTFSPSDPGGGYRMFVGYERALFSGINLRLHGSYANFANSVETKIATAGFSYNF